jgi:hypothetical protein
MNPIKRERYFESHDRLRDMMQERDDLTIEEVEALRDALEALAERAAYLEKMAKRMKADREILKKAKADLSL